MLFKPKKYNPNPFANRKAEGLRLTFCITHKNRDEFLKKTLPANLSANAGNPNVDFVVVDFNDDLSLVNWLKGEFKTELTDQRLKVYHSDELPEWHASKAKNCAHVLAEGDVLVNLDCDNFTGTEGGTFIIERFLEAQEEILLWQYSRKKLDGSYGRIALIKNTFHQLGGYDESFLPMGFQDGDLIKRAKMAGVKIERDKNPQYNGAIKHEKFVPKNMTWKNMNEHNQRLSKKNVKAGRLTANKGVFGLLAKNVTRID